MPEWARWPNGPGGAQIGSPQGGSARGTPPRTLRNWETPIFSTKKKKKKKKKNSSYSSSPNFFLFFCDFPQLSQLKLLYSPPPQSGWETYCVSAYRFPVSNSLFVTQSTTLWGSITRESSALRPGVLHYQLRLFLRIHPGAPYEVHCSRAGCCISSQLSLFQYLPCLPLDWESVRGQFCGSDTVS